MFSHRHAVSAASVIGAFTLLSSASALDINAGTYELGNHPDGNAAPPGYGLRTDELVDVTANNDVFTFDFEDDASNMQLTYDDVANTIRIFGTAFGGLDTGTGYHADWSGTWSIDVTYSNVTLAEEDDDLWHIDNPPTFIGSLSLIAGGEKITETHTTPTNLFTDAEEAVVFRLGDDKDNNGHRGHDGISGWGDLQRIRDQAAFGDGGYWLFTMSTTPVPAPAPTALMATGVFAMGIRRRR